MSATDGNMWLGDRLPRIYDASLHIRFISPGETSSQRDSAVYQYSVALFEIWEKSFTSKHVVSLSTVHRTIQRIMNEHDKFIRKCKKKGKSQRQINKEWRMFCNVNSVNLLPSEKKGRPPKKRKTEAQQPDFDALLDIGQDTSSLTGVEKIFYIDQCGPQKHSLSEEIDSEFEEERAAILTEQANKSVIEEENLSFSDPIEYQEESSLNCSREERHLKRSLLLERNARLVEKATQTPGIHDLDGIFIRPEIRTVRNFHVSVKDAICTASVRSAISIPKARIAYQAIMEKRYGHRYYLSAAEQKRFEPQLQVIDEEDEPPHPKRVRTKEEYEAYKYVLPSEKVVGTFKHDKSLHQEIMAGEALGNIDAGTKVTLHFDTTSRSRIEGEWPALILNFLSENPKNCKMVNLRSLFFAH